MKPGLSNKAIELTALRAAAHSQRSAATDEVYRSLEQ
jgi:hypothetical protein